MLYVTGQWALLLVALGETIYAMVKGDKFLHPEDNGLGLESYAFKGTLLYIVGSLVSFICFLFALPVSVLAYVQTRNFMSGLTTNERFGKGTRSAANDNLAQSQGTGTQDISQRSANRGIHQNSFSLSKRHKLKNTGSSVKRVGQEGKIEYLQADLVMN